MLFTRLSTFATLFCITLVASLSGATWQQVWSDEFNGPANTGPDGNTWHFTTGGNMPNNELECYTNSLNNCRMDGGGNLIIEARNEAACNGRSYTSARIESSGKFAMMWGKIECRAKIPSFQGSWPAFWMMGENIGSVGWPACGELDILETVNISPQWIQSSMHAPNDPWNWNGQNWLPAGQAYSDNYHVYSMEWNSTTITFFRDGIQHYQLNSWQVAANQWPYNQQNFILLNLAVGGTWPGNPNGGAGLPAQYLIDYVRVYKDTDLKRAYNNTPQVVAGRVEAEKYDEGGYGLAYMDSEPANLSGQFRPNEWVDIEAQGAASGGFNVDYTRAGEWLEYTVNATQTGSYSMRASVASGGAGGTFHINVDGVNATGTLTIPDTGGWANWGDVFATNINMTAGTHVLRLVEDSNGATGSVGNFDYFDFWIPAATPTSTVVPTKIRTPLPTFTRTATVTPTRSNTVNISPTFSATLSSTPTPTLTSSSTSSLTRSPTSTLTATRSSTPTYSSTLTFSPSSSVTPSRTITSTFSPSPPFSPTSSPTISATLTVTPSFTASPSPTPSASGTLSFTPTPTLTATLSSSPTLSSTATLTSSRTITKTPTQTLTLTPVITATATLTSTATPTLVINSPTLSSTPTTVIQVDNGDGPLEIKCVTGFPNPNPRRLAIQLSGRADSVDVEIFSKGMTLSGRRQNHAAAKGWSELELPEESATLSSGVYYARVTAKKAGSLSAPRICKLMILK